MGGDYSDATNTPEFKERFYNDWYKASATATKSGMSLKEMQVDPNTSIDAYQNLTETQISFIKRIIDESDKSSSNEVFFNRLLSINEDIYKQVPKLEQERLLMITATLYYGLVEIGNLEKQGQMLLTPLNHMRLVKTKSEPSDIGGTCRKILATTWAIALGEPTPVGEIVASVVTVIVGGVLLYEVVLCTYNAVTNPNYGYCISKWAKCYGMDNACEQCFRYCMAQNGTWPGSTMGCY